MAVCNFLVTFTVLVAAGGRRKDVEVAGRASTRVAETGLVRDVEAMRPVAVAGRVGGFTCSDFFVRHAVGVGVTRTACPRFEER